MTRHNYTKKILTLSVAIFLLTILTPTVFSIADTTPPTTTMGTIGPFEIFPPGGCIVWVTTIILTAEDNPGGSGVKELHYKIDGVEKIEFGNSVSFEITTEGWHDVYYWAVDNQDNVEITHYYPFYVDNTAPVSYSVIIPSMMHEGKLWMTSMSPIEIWSYDYCFTHPIYGVGVDYVWYNYGYGWTDVDVDGPKAHVTFNLPLDLEGHLTISYFGVDRLGNVEPVKTQEVWVDNTAPTSPGLMYMISPFMIRARLWATDYSGIGVVDGFYYSIREMAGSSPWMYAPGCPATITVPPLTLGITCFAVDALGNEGPAHYEPIENYPPLRI